MAEETIDYKKRCEEYEKRMGIGENDPAKNGYLVLVRLLNQQIEYLEKFNITEKISALAKEDAIYPRAKEMWEELPSMITKISNLRIELKMEGEEKKNTYVPVSAKSIADGNHV